MSEIDPRAAWLIERRGFDKLAAPYTYAVHWYAQNEDDGWHWWTPVAADAKRFATRADAEQFPAYRMIASDPSISVTEHIIIDALSIQPAKLKAEPVGDAMVAVQREPLPAVIYGMSQWTDEHPADPELGYSDADMAELYAYIVGVPAPPLNASPIPEQAGVGVKGLGWVKNGRARDSVWTGELGGLRVFYSIEPEDRVFRLERGWMLSDYGRDDLGLFPTRDEAERAANNDWHRLIRSALIPASPTEPVEGEGWQAAPEDIAVMPETDVPQPVKFRTASEIEAARLARKAVPSSPPASGEHEEFVLVPRELTEAMWNAFFVARDDLFPKQMEVARRAGNGWKGMPVVVWAAMIAAAPNARDGR